MFGESDEEKAARQQQEQAQDAGISTLNERASDLEESLRRLTGQVEQLDHRIDEMNERLTRMQKDFDYKLCSLAAQQLGATNGSDDQGGLPCGGQQRGAATQAQGTAEASGPPVRLAPPPGVLGTLPESAVAGTQEGASPPPSEVASTDTRSQFDAAMNLLAKAQYDEARAAFRSFVDNNPKDELAPQAIYWVADIAFVQKDFAGAAHTFAEGLKNYPASPRAPESMLKLGQSLIALNQKKEGCLALDALPSKYRSASKTVTERALAARKEAHCR
jgi:tol-pal system protein YbgF